MKYLVLCLLFLAACSSGPTKQCTDFKDQQTCDRESEMRLERLSNRNHRL